MNVDSERTRRSRKSAPVKNAVFVGAMNKDRFRLGTSNQCSVNVTSDHESKRTRGRKSRVSDISMPKESPVRMSTPVRNCNTSPRYRTRNRSKVNSDEHNRSRSILSSITTRRKYHPKYDPFIEIRRAQERLDRYRTQGDFKVDLLLCDDADEDLQRYEDKIKRRLSDRGELFDPDELERRQMELLRRQKDIDLGKVTERYAEYVLSIPKPERERYHPRTPNKFRKVSRRAWDGMIRKWRKHLHSFDDFNFETSWRSLSTTDMSDVGSISSQYSLPSNSENVDPLEERKQLSDGLRRLSDDFQTPNALTASPTVKMPTRYRSQTQEDDEDTLQGQSKSWKDEKCHDEDTLSSIPKPQENRRVTRSLSGNKPAKYEPAGDILHCGLTNDMHLLTSGQKRSSSHLYECNNAKQKIANVHSLSEFPYLQSESSTASPSKRIKRGILTLNGIKNQSN